MNSKDDLAISKSQCGPLKIAVSSDLSGFGRYATVFASMVRRTRRRIHIKYFCQNFLPESTSAQALEIAYYPAASQRAGSFPSHVGSAVFDRLQVIPDAREWDRCLILDHDQLVLCDLAPYFDEDFEGNLLMGRLFGPGKTLGLQMASRGGLPKKLRYAENYPYFYMGPMMNLTAMRKARTWEKLLKAHAILQQEEQMALTIASEGKVKGVGRKWNLVPQWDHLAEGPSGSERSAYGTVGEPARWVNGLPEGIIHWTGPAKPWHYDSQVWRPDLWESEETSWEALRRGWWEKPRAVEIGPADEKDVMALARRGWKVEVISDPRHGHKAKALPFPDVHWHTPAQAKRRRPDWLHGAEMVRFGLGEESLPWLTKTQPLPPCLVLRGPVKKGVLTAIRKLGYGRMARLNPHGWPGGGPAPSVLDYASWDGPAFTLPEGEDLYLQFTSRQTPRADLGAPGK